MNEKTEKLKRKFTKKGFETKIPSLKGEIVNLTGHEVFQWNTGKSYPTTGISFRTTTINKPVKYIDGALAKEGSIGVFGFELPPEKEGTFYLVSAMVLKKVLIDHPERKDFISPGPLQTKEGKVGCVGWFCNFEELQKI